MSYFSTTRARAYSKPTREELKEFSYHLSQKSEHELRQICQLAIAESSDVAHVLMKVMRDADLLPNNYPQQRGQQQPSIFCDNPTRMLESDTGLPTPTETSEDSEMGGTENMMPHIGFQPQPQPQLASTSFNNGLSRTYPVPLTINPSLSSPPPKPSRTMTALATSFSRLHSSTPVSTVIPTGASLPTSFSSIQPTMITTIPISTATLYHHRQPPQQSATTATISNKRKSLADRDDNVPTPFPDTTTNAAATKKRCTAFPFSEWQTQHQQQQHDVFLQL